MSSSSESANFDFRNGLQLDGLEISQTPVAVEGIELPTELSGIQIIEAVKKVSEHAYREKRLSRDGIDHFVIGQGSRDSAGHLAVLGLDENRWTPIDPRMPYAGLVAVSAMWLVGPINAVNVYDENIIKRVRNYGQRLTEELGAS